MKRLILQRAGTGVMALGLFLVSCHDECDPGQTLVDQTCHDTAKSTDSGTNGGTGGTTAAPVDAATEAVDARVASGSAGGSGGAGGTADDSAFGKTCTTDGDCSGTANYCPIQPGKTSGYCTAKVAGCTPPPAACPKGWTCFDLASVGVMGQPAFCLKP